MKKLDGISRAHVSAPNATVIMGCELSVPVTPGQLSECTALLCKTHPLICQAVHIDEQNEAIMTNSDPARLEIIEYHRWKYETIVERHLKEEWKLDGLLIKFIVNQVGSYSQVIISCNHAICDGLSLVYLLEDIAAYFQGAESSTADPSTSLHPSEMKDQHAQWPFELVAFILSRKWKKIPLTLTEEMLSDIHSAYWRQHDCRVLSVVLNPEQTKKIIDEAKRYHVTVNTYLTHILHQSQRTLAARRFQDDVVISVNLRDKLKTHPGRQFGYFVTGVRMNLGEMPETTSDSLKGLQAVINKNLSSRSLFKSLALYFFPPRFFDLIQLNKFGIRDDKAIKKFLEKQGAGRIKTAIAITNLGILKTTKNVEKTLTRFLPLCIVSDTMEKYVSIFTHDDRMHIGICYDPKLIGDEEMDGFKDSFLGRI